MGNKGGRPQNQNNKKEFLKLKPLFYDNNRTKEQQDYIKKLQEIENIPTDISFKYWYDLWEKLNQEYFDNPEMTIPDNSINREQEIILSGFISAFYDIYRTSEHTNLTEEYAIYDKTIFTKPFDVELAVCLSNDKTINTTISLSKEQLAKIEKNTLDSVDFISNKKIISQKEKIQSITITKKVNYMDTISNFDEIIAEAGDYIENELSISGNKLDSLNNETDNNEEELSNPPFPNIYNNTYYNMSINSNAKPYIIVENLPTLYDRFDDLIINNKFSTQLGSYIPNADLKINRRIGTLICRAPYCFLTILQNYTEIQQTCKRLQTNDKNGKRKKTVDALFKVYSILSQNTLFPEKSIFNSIFAEDITHYNLCRYLYHGFAQGLSIFLSSSQKKSAKKTNYRFKTIPLIEDNSLIYYFNIKDETIEAKMYISAISYYVKKIASIRHIPTQLIVANYIMDTLFHYIDKQKCLLYKPSKKGEYSIRENILQDEILQQLDREASGLMSLINNFYNLFAQKNYNKVFIYYYNSHNKLKTDDENAYELNELFGDYMKKYFYQEEGMQSDDLYCTTKKNKKTYLPKEKRGIYKDLYNFLVCEVQKCFSSMEEINQLLEQTTPNELLKSVYPN